MGKATDRSPDSRALPVGLSLLARVARPLFRRKRRAFVRSTDVDSILVLELWNIGDLILLMPFLAQLRREFPRARVSLLARPVAEELLAGTGLVDEIIVADLTWTPDESAYDRTAKRITGLWKTWRRLRTRDFDVAFSARQHIRERFVLAMARARRRVGFGFAAADAILSDVVPADGVNRHRVEEWMRLLEPFGPVSSVPSPRLHVSQSERSWAIEYLTARGIRTSDLLIGIHPGASLAEKRWPLERFREVAAALAVEKGIRVLALAEPSGYGSELFDIHGVIGAQVSLRELIALTERCDLLVCNDSGPMHIAGALGVPTVAMFGAGIEQWFAPLGDGHELVRPDSVEAPADSPGRGQRVRAPTAIATTQVLAAVSRAVQRLRGEATFSRV